MASASAPGPSTTSRWQREPQRSASTRSDRSTSGAAPRACRDVVGSLNDADRNARSSRGSQHREDPWVADLPLVDDLELVEADDPP